jgi:hypothetical protein
MKSAPLKPEVYFLLSNCSAPFQILNVTLRVRALKGEKKGRKKKRKE